MNLGFSEYWPKTMPPRMAGKATGFKEKIWKSIYLSYSGEWEVNANIPLYSKAKKHTMRRDKADRWKPGKLIHFVVGNRTKNRWQFAPVIPCVSTQKVEIKHFYDLIEVKIDGTLWIARKNAKGVPYEWDIQLQILAQNDGFETVEDFFAWFNEDWKGKLIHWTDLTY